jgi:hypothetical protein
LGIALLLGQHPYEDAKLGLSPLCILHPHGRRNEISSSKEARRSQPVRQQAAKKRGKCRSSRDINVEEPPGKATSRKETKLQVVA